MHRKSDQRQSAVTVSLIAGGRAKAAPVVVTRGLLSAVPGLTEGLADAGWRLRSADEVASRDWESPRPNVGLIVFGPDNMHDAGVADLDDLFGIVGGRWIAIVPHDVEEHEVVWKFIGRRCFDYHRLPLDLTRLLIVLGHAFGMEVLEARLDARLRQSMRWEDLVGTSAPIRAARRQIEKLAAVDAPVLIQGESGTGKELAARAIHRLSDRGDGPFEAVNCAAIPAGLIQTELFGHEKGSFTGAHARHPGRFEMAHGGTLFLDEIGDLPLELQVVLLRTLDEKTIRRVGGTEDIPLDVRVIAATHVGLSNAVEDGRFREDLYYRLGVLNLEMPPLRVRGSDIEALARYFADAYCEEIGRDHVSFSRTAAAVMRSHDWPGNVRELMNRVQQAIVLCDGGLIKPTDLGLERRRSRRSVVSLEAAKEEAEKRAVLDAVRRNAENITQAARELGVSRNTVYRLIKKHRLEPPPE